MRLLHYPHAPYSRKVLLAAYEKGVVFESELCAPFERAARERLRAVHPLATVPILIDGAEVLTESSIIVEHFDLASDLGPMLVPRDARAALRVRACDRFGDAHLMGPTAYLAWSLRKAPELQNVDKIRAQRGVVDTALDLLDRSLTAQAFLAGDAITMADLSPAAAISCLLSDRTVPDLARWPAVARWYGTMITRPSFLRILEECTKVALPPGF